MAVTVAVAAATTTGPEETAAPSPTVELPPAEEVAGGREPPSPAEGANEPIMSQPPASLGCEPDGCLVWWTEHIDHRPTAVAGDVLVHEGRDGVVGIDVRTGELLWRRDLPENRPVVTPPYAPHLMVADAGGWVTARGSHLWFRTLSSGEIEGEAHLEDLRITRLERYGSGVLVAGYPSDPPYGPHDERLVLVRNDGEVVWQHEDTRVLDVRTDTPVGVLVDDEHEVAFLDPSGGTDRWRQEAGDAHHFFAGANLVRVTTGPETAALERLQPFDGTLLQRREFDGELQFAFPIGASLLHAVVDDEAHLIDADSLRTREVRPARSFHPGEAPIATRTRDGIAVLWPDAESSDPELLVYGYGAGEPLRIALDRHPGVPQAGWNEIHDLGDGVVRVVLAGAQVIDVDLDAAEAVRVLSPAEGWYTEQGLLAALRGADGDSLEFHGALVLVRADDEPRLVGERGEIHLTGASRVVSSDPLIVHGGAGAMRLDRDLLLP